jgi:urea transport system ATP-binding protein
MLEVRHLEVAYGRSQVLFDVSFDLAGDGFTSVMGRNGVGKTTLLNAVVGVLRPRSGRIVWEGRDITGLGPAERVRAGLGYVPQGHPTFPHLTVAENLRVVVEAVGSRAALDDALDLFPGLRPLLGRRAGFLSGGQQQQLAFARALAARPRLLVLDEPTEGIQPSIIVEIEEAVARLHAAGGVAVLLVEQYVEFALRLARDYVVLEAGEVVAAGATADLEEATARRLLSV